MFYEALEQEAENQHLSEIAIPMLVGSKLNISQDVFVNIQLFSILMVEGSALNTGAVYFEVTGQVADLSFHAQNVNGLDWVALTNYKPYVVAEMLSSYFHNLRLLLFIDIVKQLHLSKALSVSVCREFLAAVEACYPGVELKETSCSLDQLAVLLAKHDSDLRGLESAATCERGVLFNKLNSVVSKSEELLFEKLAKGVSIDRIKELRSAYSPL